MSRDNLTRKEIGWDRASDRGMDHMVWNTNLDGVRGSPIRHSPPGRGNTAWRPSQLALETRNAEVRDWLNIGGDGGRSRSVRQNRSANAAHVVASPGWGAAGMDCGTTPACRRGDGETRHLPALDSLARFGGRVMHLGTGRPFGGGRFCFGAPESKSEGV